MAKGSLHNPSAGAQRSAIAGSAPTAKPIRASVSTSKNARSKPAASSTAGASSTSMSTPVSPVRRHWPEDPKAASCSPHCDPAT
jgi:hypothetical protein